MTAIKERPILFSAPMVNAIREGRKTQTRRIVKLRKGQEIEHGAVFSAIDPFAMVFPFGRVGDRLWVRETWALVNNYGEDGLDDWDEPIPSERPWLSSAQVWYRADHPWGTDNVEDRGFRWRPSIFMPRWASRILLEITDVKVERLNDISPQDAWNEGCRCSCLSPVPACKGNIDAFQSLWESINGKDSWAANPWLWTITFREITK